MQLTIQRTGELADSYAARLNNNLRYAWSAAYQATKDDQGKRVADAIRQSPGSVTTYKEGDRVARKLYGAANKLEYLYAGPYRIDEVLPNGRYKLRDLENGNIFDELDVSNLRPYYTPTEGGELAKDVASRLVAGPLASPTCTRRTRGGDALCGARAQAARCDKSADWGVRTQRSSRRAARRKRQALCRDG